MESLQQNFVNAWVIGKKLPTLAESASSDLVRKIAREARSYHGGAVDSLVVSPTGKVLGHQSANALISQFHNHEAIYLKFLDQGLERFEESIY